MDSTQKHQNSSGLFYGWVIVAASACIYAVAAGQVSCFGIFVKPMAIEFSCTRASLTVAITIYIVTMSVFTFVSGFLVDRIGPKILSITGGISMALGFFLSSRVSEVWQFYLTYGFLAGMGFSCIFVPLSSIIPRWFVEKNGLALGLFFASGGIGGLIIAPLLQHWINLYEWRSAFDLLAVIAFCVIIPPAFFLKKAPEDMGLLPLGAKPANIQNNQKTDTAMKKGRDFTVPEALKAPSFWIFSIAMLLLYMGTLMAQIHMVPHATDKGISASTAALALGIAAALNALGRLATGAASDFFGTKRSLCFCLFLSSISLLWLILVKETWMIFVFAIPFGFAFGGALPQRVRATSELFGIKSMGSILGISTTISSVGPAAGPVLGAAVFDRTGSYTLAFTIGSISILIAFVLLLTLKLPGKKQR